MAEPAVVKIPSQTKKKSDVVENFKTKSGFEGYEKELGQSISIVLKMLGSHAGYSHELNDPLVKAHMLAIQFAKNNGILDQFIQHDLDTMAPINERVHNIIAKTGEKEIALVGLFDRTACHYVLALDSEGSGNSRSWSEPFNHVLTAAKKLGQFDLTPEEIHEKWTKPRLYGYAKAMGVEIKVSDIGEDRRITVELVD